eukprot:CAMPEP_0113949486 /NCGR_PEP_ID=MMETSP1339-20121228/75953_1 /TAXON_ID=94617 /ORGANISM="Fibrocapsa japonica" /LENGTH=222 /DNA_ID=CAMNT_0000956957 /DNA_START=111 /DNA_END=779 /DNA_ORIENTATION=+ /assembly_acc=CAM_ASM_000762
MSPVLLEPSQRDAKYGTNVARYLLDLHESEATFDFCGGMMFQLMLTDQLREHLTKVASQNEDGNETINHFQPKIFDATKARMFNLPDYDQSANADNINIFHGRELRKVPHAKGGFGFVLQLSMAMPDGADSRDPEGWSAQEMKTYDGWAHDIGRTWRKADDYEAEGFKDFKQKFGSEAFGLNHRFYLHLDGSHRMWLSAEDGCEGTPAKSTSRNPVSRIFGL